MILIDNQTQASLLTMAECVDVLERAFGAIDKGQAIYRPKTDVNVPNSKSNEYYRFGSMEGWFDGIFAIRFMSEVMTFDHQPDGSWREGQYSVEKGKNCAVVLLFSSENGEPLALLNDNWIQHMRVGGTAGLGTKLLAREDAETVCMIGSGGMAQTFLEGLCAVRPIKRARVYSPSRNNRETYAANMSKRLAIQIEAVDNARDAMAGADIVATCTNSGSPVFEENWLEPGMHVVCVGTNEVPPEAIPRFDISVRQGIHSMAPSGDIERHRAGVGLSYAGFVAGTDEEMARIPDSGTAHIDASAFPKYVDVIAGRANGRTDASQITFYYCHGNQGLQFASVGGKIYRNAMKIGAGTPMPLEWFVQERKHLD
ncbi:MAG: ornithine cyclodeaminase family protein [Pseudomonadales bacterium]|nr:ornithine cyclodeaminase family protein [Pseudomonadales bacterium]